MTKLSKEAKIGVGVLAILAVVFVVVLVGRLIGPGGDKAVATEEQVKPLRRRRPRSSSRRPPASRRSWRRGTCRASGPRFRRPT